jgi:hypothetical protein
VPIALREQHAGERNARPRRTKSYAPQLFFCLTCHRVVTRWRILAEDGFILRTSRTSTSVDVRSRCAVRATFVGYFEIGPIKNKAFRW